LDKLMLLLTQRELLEEAGYTAERWTHLGRIHPVVGYSSEVIELFVAEDLLHRHIETLVADNARWQTMLADDVVWELPFAPALGHPARVSGRAEVVQFAAWFVGAVESFRFFDVRVQAFADPEAAVAEVKGEGRIKATGRSYRQEYVVFLRAAADKIVYLREYFDPTRAAKSMDATILDLEPWF